MLSSGYPTNSEGWEHGPLRYAYVRGLGKKSTFDNVEDFVPASGWAAYEEWVKHFNPLATEGGFGNPTAKTIPRIKQLILKQQPHSRPEDVTDPDERWQVPRRHIPGM